MTDEAVTAPRSPVTSCPHLAAKESAPNIMLWVVGALAPAASWAVWNMGATAATVFAVSIVSCLGTEALWNYLAKRPQSLTDWSALVTAILLAMTLPPRTPWWMVLAGGVVAIGLGKMLFGGLGWNLFNPALVGRAIVTISWAGVLAVQKVPGGWFQGIDIPETGGLDAINGATRLAIAAADRAAGGGYGFDLQAQFQPLLFRNLEGCIGEVSAALLILGGVVLIAKGIIDWRIPAGYVGTVAVLSGLCGTQGFVDEAVFNVLAGGVLLGAFFMATDYVTSPMTKTGRLIFACGCGLINCVGRFYGPMPESTTFAILFMNGLVPLIDRSLRPRTYGWVGKRE